MKVELEMKGQAADDFLFEYVLFALSSIHMRSRFGWDERNGSNVHTLGTR